MDRQMLYKRIEDRIDGMLDQGLVAEVTSLMERGVRSDAISMQGLGYKEISSYLRGEVSLEEAVTWLKRDTRHFAKRQLSWFRHMKDIQWVDVTDFGNFSAHAARIHEIIAGKFRTDLEYTSKTIQMIIGVRAKMNKSINIQDTFLNQLRKDSIPVTVYLINGFQVRGTIKAFDNFTIVIDSDGKQQLIYKHAISTFTPQRNVSLVQQQDNASDN